jgi:hypothetical protein
MMPGSCSRYGHIAHILVQFLVEVRCLPDKLAINLPHEEYLDIDSLLAF